MNLLGDNIIVRFALALNFKIVVALAVGIYFYNNASDETEEEIEEEIDEEPTKKTTIINYNTIIINEPESAEKLEKLLLNYK